MSVSKEPKLRKISFFNWFVTLLFSIVPGVNIVFFIFTIACARTASKRSFAIAALVLSLLLLIAGCIGVIFFGEEIVKWAQSVLETQAK